jgi:hypothetical protein
VLTQCDYDYHHSRSPYFAAKLLPAFTEHPMVFMGCSATDADVVFVLSSVAACLTAESVDKPKDRLIFVELDPKSRSRSGRLIPTTVALLDGLQLPVLSMRVADCRGVFQALVSRHRSLPARLLRSLKERVHDLVIERDPQDRLHAEGVDDKTLGETDVVFGVGTIAHLQVTRYRDLRRLDLLEDLVVADAGLDPTAVVAESLPPILRYARLTPAFKYLRGAGLLDDAGELRTDGVNLHDRVREFASNPSARCLPPPSYAKVANRVLRNFAGYRRSAEDRSVPEALWYGCLVPREMVDLVELREFLKVNWRYLNSTAAVC